MELGLGLSPCSSRLLSSAGSVRPSARSRDDCAGRAPAGAIRAEVGATARLAAGTDRWTTRRGPAHDPDQRGAWALGPAGDAGARGRVRVPGATTAAPTAARRVAPAADSAMAVSSWAVPSSAAAGDDRDGLTQCQAVGPLSDRMSMRQPVSLAASRAFCPSRPMASDSIRSGTVTAAMRFSSSMSTPTTCAGRERVGDEHGRVVRPGDDVDLLAAQLRDDRLYATAALAHGGAHRVQALLAAGDGDLAAAAGLAGDGLDLHGAGVRSPAPPARTSGAGSSCGCD